MDVRQMSRKMARDKIKLVAVKKPNSLNSNLNFFGIKRCVHIVLASLLVVSFAPIILLVWLGVTGWAQVSGAVDLTPKEHSDLETWYARHASPRLNIQVLFNSVKMIFQRDEICRGAIAVDMQRLAVGNTGTARG